MSRREIYHETCMMPCRPLCRGWFGLGPPRGAGDLSPQQSTMSNQGCCREIGYRRRKLELLTVTEQPIVQGLSLVDVVLD